MFEQANLAFDQLQNVVDIMSHNEQHISQLTARNLELVAQVEQLQDNLVEANACAATRQERINQELEHAEDVIRATERELATLQQENAATEQKLQTAQQELRQLKALNPEKQAKLIKRLKTEKAELQQDVQRLRTTRSSATAKTKEMTRQLGEAGYLINELYNLLRRHTCCILSDHGDYYTELVNGKVDVGGETQYAVRICHRSGGGARLYALDADGELGHAPTIKGGFRPNKAAITAAHDFLTGMKANNWQLTNEQIAKYSGFQQQLHELTRYHKLTLLGLPE
ncbi:hypothetical protein GCM10011369_23140 [Neiella marina]|uniref:Uncharacterized protein n=1 Tax=Neiella marina TaxID=508461 RepID=A0A8J2XPJ1_9GAMM|nr:hypothetical protein [Neiella marina]GGA80585.1 hypothetical protein GCM10011369_23140 [Neiella marina]